MLFRSEEDLLAAMRNGHEDFLDPEIPSNGVIPLKKVVRAVTKRLERKLILRALDMHQWNRRKAAHALCISYPGLLCKMREAGVRPTRGPRACLEVAREEELNWTARGSDR